MPPPISLRSNERVLLTGKTGSGKTYLARYITRRLRRLVVLDGKGTLSDWELEPWAGYTRQRLMSGEDIRIRALPPVGTSFAAYWDEVVLACYHAGNVTLYIDELYAVCPPNKNPSDAMWSIYTRGREMGVGVWASTQRPVWVPLFALSEAEHFFMFRLQLMEDRQRMAAYMSGRVLSPIRDTHGFWYSSATMDEPIYTERLEVTEDEQKGKLIVKTKVTTPPREMENRFSRQPFRTTRQ